MALYAHAVTALISAALAGTVGWYARGALADVEAEWVRDATHESFQDECPVLKITRVTQPPKADYAVQVSGRFVRP